MSALLLAGCFGGGEPISSQVIDDGTSMNATVPTGRGPIAAFEETNKTEEGAGGLDHHHDVWQGRERVLFFEGPAMMAPRPDGQNRAISTFTPPQGSFVYEGTGSIDFTIANPKRHACEPFVTESGRFYCTDWIGQPGVPPVDDPLGGPSGLKLRYKHAIAKEWIDVGELKWGVALPIQIKLPIESDMPHVTSSLWAFQVVSPNPYDATLTFDVRVELVRGPEGIPLWPGHPDFYADNPVRVVVDKRDAVSARGGYAGHGAAIVPKDAGPVQPDKVVSYGTRTLYVWANITDYQAPNPATAPRTWYLYHMNATGRANITNPFDFENHAIEKKEHFWVLPVDDNSMDSPYAEASRWSFELAGAYTPPAGPTFYDGFASYAVKYTLVVHASPVELAPEEYHMYCLQSGDYCPEPEPSGG